MNVETVLVVDDSRTTCAFVEAALVSAGYAVKVANDGAQGLALFEKNTPDLVLLDIVMPGMDGFEVCRKIRGLAQGVDIPIVFLTSLEDLESHQKAMDAGADDLLTKPISRTELMLRVRSMAWMHRLRADLRSGYNLIRSQRDALVHVQQQKDELTNLIVHDLKNPLSNIIGYADLLATNGAAMQQRIPEVAGYIVDSGRVMLRLVTNMLDIKRSEDGALLPNLSQVDVSNLVDGLRKDMGGLLATKKITLSINKQLNGETFKADADLVWRVLENLVDNAIRYTPASTTITLDVRTTEDKGLEFRVRDEGPGVPKDFRDTIFTKYIQLEQQGPPKSRGNMGLGLTFCHLAVEAHSGKIWVEDNQPKGACFCVRLPPEASRRTAKSDFVREAPKT